jgi:hypothetical protein
MSATKSSNLFLAKYTYARYHFNEYKPTVLMTAVVVVVATTLATGSAFAESDESQGVRSQHLRVTKGQTTHFARI